MKTNFIPNLQRDMMYYGDYTPTTSKFLNIKNIGKLVGMQTNYYGDGWVCVDVQQFTMDYLLTFNSANPNKPTMKIQVLIERMEQYGNCYIVELKVTYKQKNGDAWITSSPDTYTCNEGVFSTPKSFSNWIDTKLIGKRVRFEEETWKNIPWYGKLKIKIESFIKSI